MVDVKISEMDDIGASLSSDDILPIVDSPSPDVKENKTVTVGDIVELSRSGILDDVGDLSIFYSTTSENASIGSKALTIESTLASDGVTLVPTVEGESISSLLVANAGRYRLKYNIGFRLDTEIESDKKILAYLTAFGTPVPCSIASAFLRSDQDYAQLSGTAVMDLGAESAIAVACLSDTAMIKTADNSIDGFTPVQYKLMVSVERIK